MLTGLLDPDNQAIWQEFDARYRPMILAFSQRLGLTEDDAADVTQETLVRFIRDYRAGKYDPQRGRLRSWIIAMVKARAVDLKRSRAARREVRGESAIVDLPAESELDQLWEAERRQVLLRQALGELRTQTRLTERTLLAFEEYVIRGRPVGEVARELGLTDHDVYMAKNRVADRLRETLQRLDDLFDDG